MQAYNIRFLLKLNPDRSLVEPFVLDEMYKEEWPGSVALVVGGSSDIRKIGRALKKDMRDIHVGIYQHHESLLTEGSQPAGNFLLLITEALFNKRWSPIRESLDLVFDMCECHRIRQEVIEGYGWSDVLTTLRITFSMQQKRRGACGCKYIPLVKDLPRENGRELTATEKHEKVPHDFIGFPLPDVFPDPGRVMRLIRGYRQANLSEPNWKDDEISFNTWPLANLLEQALTSDESNTRRLSVLLLVCAVQITSSQNFAPIFQPRRNLLKNKESMKKLAELSSFVCDFLSSNGTTSLEIGLTILLLRRGLKTSTLVDELKSLDGHLSSNVMPQRVRSAFKNVVQEMLHLMRCYLDSVMESLNAWEYKPAGTKTVPSVHNCTQENDAGLVEFLQTQIMKASSATCSQARSPPTGFVFELEPADGNRGFNLTASPLEPAPDGTVCIHDFDDAMEEVFNGIGCHPTVRLGRTARFHVSQSRRAMATLLAAGLDCYLNLCEYDKDVSDDEGEALPLGACEYIEFQESESVESEDKFNVCFSTRPAWLLNPLVNPLNVQLKSLDTVDQIGCSTAGPKAVYVLKRHVIPDTMFLSSNLLDATQHKFLITLHQTSHASAHRFEAWSLSLEGNGESARMLSAECETYKNDWASCSERVLDQGYIRDIASRGHTEYHVNEATVWARRSMESAFRRLERNLDRMDKYRLLSLHKDLTNGDPGVQGGILRCVNVRVGHKRFPSHSDLPMYWNAFWKEFEYVLERTAISAYAKAAWAMNWMLALHPFSDGNGRCARLLGAWVLRHEGVPCWVPFMFERSQRRTFNEAVRYADSHGGDISRLAFHVLQCTHRVWLFLLQGRQYEDETQSDPSTGSFTEGDGTSTTRTSDNISTKEDTTEETTESTTTASD